jgi:hypothetical protein
VTIKESNELRELFNSRSRVTEKEVEQAKQAPFTELHYPRQSDKLRFKFIDRILKNVTKYELEREEDFFLALKKKVESGSNVGVHLSVNCSVRRNASLRQPFQIEDFVTSVTAEARCSDRVYFLFSFPVDTALKDQAKYKEGELNERATCLGSLALLSFAGKITNDLPLVPVECGPSNILSNRFVLRDIIRITEKYGIEVPHLVELLLSA